MNIKKSLALVLVLFLLIILSGCYKQDRYIFSDGVFSYRGQPVSFYEDLEIVVLSITLKEISEEVYLSSENYNVLKNHNNKLHYSVVFQMKYTVEEKPREYEFEYLGKVPGQNDSYKIIVFIDNEDIGITGSLTMTLYFQSAIGSSTDIGSYAGQVTMYVRTYEINGIKHNDKYHDFPRSLDYIKLVDI